MPYSAWSELESLIAEAGIDDSSTLSVVVMNIARIARAGNVDSGMAYQYIPDVVTTLRRKVDAGKFHLFMDCLAVLCDEGTLSVGVLNEFLDDNKIGYRACDQGFPKGIVWEKVEEKPAEVGKDDEDISENVEQNDEEKATSKGRLRKVHKVAEKNKNSMRDEIFISHRTVDAPFADMILDYLSGCEIPKEKIFCSSFPGNDVNERIGPEVKEHLQKAAIIILILSKGYYESAYCINEAGVAWYLDEVVSIPIGLPDINHKDMVGFLDQGYKLRRIDNDDDVAFLFDKAQEKLNAGTTRHSIITRETKKLKDRYKKEIDHRNVKGDSRNKVEEDDNFDFGDLDNLEESMSYNPIVQIIINAGGSIKGIDSIVDASGFTEAMVRRKLKEALDKGEIEAVGSARKQEYRIVTGDTGIKSLAVCQDDVGNIPVDSAFLLVYAAFGDGKIMKVQTLGSPIQVSASGRQFMADESQRESARWVEALDRLISWSWVRSVGSKGQIYELTGTGYKKADWLKENMGINTDNEPLEELKEFEL